MSAKEIKNKITKSLELMNESQLRSAWLMVNELRKQEQYNKVKVDSKVRMKKIAIGIHQLDNGEGTDFREFLNDMKATYGNKQ